MLKNNKLVCFLVIFFFLLSITQLPINAREEKTSLQQAKNHVVIISIDGLKPEYYTKADQYKLKIPNIRKLCQEGSFAEGSETVYPSLTYPAHTTLVTGVRPALHGIYSNQVWLGPKSHTSEEWYWYAKAIKVPTLWSQARKAGLKTATVGWPVTTDGEIDYLVPEIWQGGFDTSFKVSMEKSTPPLAEMITKTLPDPPPNILNDLVRAQATNTIIANYKPNLLLVHFAELDFIEHTKGVFSQPALEKLEETDTFIGKVIETTKQAGILERTSFFIVSDHGFTSIEKQFRPAVLLAKEGFITLSKEGKLLDWQAVAFGQGGSSAIMLKDPNDKATATKVIEVFEKFAAKPNSPLNRVIKGEEIAKLGTNPSAVCFLEPAPGYEINSELTGDLTEKSERYKGTHGGLPTRSEMYASFIASGYGIKKGIREPFTKNIHVAPTAAALLGFSMPTAEGKPIREILTIPVPKIKK
ncbi:MAG: alkaline phosphatase family protein [Acidobacteria bacterium]|nr:alkaline phosphatase family protein [Acidobacteriota bacterium]